MAYFRGDISERLKGVLSYITELPVLQMSLAVLLGAAWDGVVGSVWTVGFGAIWVGGCAVLGRRFQSLKKWPGFGLGLLLIGLRIVWTQFNQELPENHVSHWNGNFVVVQAIVTEDISMKPEQCSVVLEAQQLCEGSGLEGDVVESTASDENCTTVEGRIQTWISRYPRVTVGDVIVISGELRQPEDFGDSDSDEEDSTSSDEAITSAADEFSYESYLASKDIYSLMYRPEVNYTHERRVFLVYGWMIDFRDALIDKINRLLPEPHASLLAGILLGARRSMPEDFAEALRTTGTTHVIAASGYNVTLVINAIVSVLRFLHRRVRVIVSIAAVWGFVILSGASLPVVRAGIMGSLALLALLSGNMSTVHISLPLSGALMALVNPGVIGSISFQLSFVSTFGLIYVVPVLQRIFPWIPESLEDSTLVTLAAILVTFPITAFNFNQFSAIAPIANFLVLPVIGVVMLLGLVLVVIPLWLRPLAILVACITWVPLEYFVHVVDLLGNLSFASIGLPNLPVWSVFLYYLILVLVVLKFYPKKHQNLYFIKDIRS